MNHSLEASDAAGLGALERSRKRRRDVELAQHHCVEG